jgi:hypothetical protein
MVNAVRCPHRQLQTVLIAAPGLSVESLHTTHRVGGRHRATPINGIALRDGEERAPSRRSARLTGRDGGACDGRRSGGDLRGRRHCHRRWDLVSEFAEATRSLKPLVWLSWPGTPWRALRAGLECLTAWVSAPWRRCRAWPGTGSAGQHDRSGCSCGGLSWEGRAGFSLCGGGVQALAVRAGCHDLADHLGCRCRGRSGRDVAADPGPAPVAGHRPGSDGHCRGHDDRDSRQPGRPDMPAGVGRSWLPAHRRGWAGRFGPADERCAQFGRAGPVGRARLLALRWPPWPEGSPRAGLGGVHGSRCWP